MSSGQVRDDPVDARTVFFCLAAVLYEMLSGHRVFPAGPVVESGYAILHNEPEQLPATVPPQVAQVVHRCLEKDAERRFQTARDLAFNLELVRTPTGSTGQTATAPGVVARRNRWRRWLWPSAAALVVLGGSAATYFAARAARPTMPTVEQVTFRRGTVFGARFNPEGRVVFSAAWGGQPLEIYTRPPGSPETQPLGLRNADVLAVSATGELAV